MQDDDTDEIMAILDDFDSQEAQHSCIMGGSWPVKMGILERGFADTHDRLCLDCVTANPLYNDRLFRRQFRMRRSLFGRIMDGVVAVIRILNRLFF